MANRTISALFYLLFITYSEGATTSSTKSPFTPFYFDWDLFLQISSNEGSPSGNWWNGGGGEFVSTFHTIDERSTTIGGNSLDLPITIYEKEKYLSNDNPKKNNYFRALFRQVQHISAHWNVTWGHSWVDFKIITISLYFVLNHLEVAKLTPISCIIGLINLTSRLRNAFKTVRSLVAHIWTLVVWIRHATELAHHRTIILTSQLNTKSGSQVDTSRHGRNSFAQRSKSLKDPVCNAPLTSFSFTLHCVHCISLLSFVSCFAAFFPVEIATSCRTTVQSC